MARPKKNRGWGSDVTHDINRPMTEKEFNKRFETDPHGATMRRDADRGKLKYSEAYIELDNKLKKKKKK